MGVTPWAVSLIPVPAQRHCPSSAGMGVPLMPCPCPKAVSQLCGMGVTSGDTPSCVPLTPRRSHPVCTTATPALSAQTWPPSAECTSGHSLHLPRLWPLVGIVLPALIPGHLWLAVPHHADVWNTDPWEACHVDRALQQSYIVSVDGGIAAHRVIRVDSKNLQIGSLKWWNHYRNLFNWSSSHSRLVEPAKSKDCEGGFWSMLFFLRLIFGWFICIFGRGIFKSLNTYTNSKASSNW